MGSCFQLSFVSGSSCFCWLCSSCCLPLWVLMPKATVMYQLNPTATTATLCLMVTSQDTVTMAMQHPMDTSPEPDTATTAFLMATSPDTATTAFLMATSPDTATTVTLPMSPDTTTHSVMYNA